MAGLKLTEGQKYDSKYGLLTYTGFFRHGGFYCDGCDRQRSIHEFLKGDYPQHTQIYHYGTECVKKFIREAELKSN